MIRPPRSFVAFTLPAALCLCLAADVVQCRPVSEPDAGAEAGVVDARSPAVPIGPAVTGVCALVEGIDSDNVLRNVCATATEIATIVQFILTLRTEDAGPPTGSCVTLPSSSLCATSPERAKAVLFISRVRERRLMLDSGL